GPLGRADRAVWHEVRSALDDRVPLSVALGELNDWSLPGAAEDIPANRTRISYFKLGLSQADTLWPERWRIVRDRFAQAGSPQAGWVAVVYADWQIAGAPNPDDVIGTALELNECRGVLVDTWDKSRPSLLDESWQPLADRVRANGR